MPIIKDHLEWTLKFLQQSMFPEFPPKNEDPSLVNGNRRMLGQLLGTLERFRKEDMQLSGLEAYMRRSDSLRRAEQRAREESARLRQEEQEQIAERLRRDLTLRARVAVKAEEKKLELLFLRWCDHYKKLGNFIRTKSEPPIYYTFAKPLDEDLQVAEQQKEQIFQQWKAARREELSQYQKQIVEQYVTNVENELERWQNGRKGRKAENDMANLQETMDKELETHRLSTVPRPERFLVEPTIKMKRMWRILILGRMTRWMMYWMLMRTAGELKKQQKQKLEIGVHNLRERISDH